jgi:hypothetical protein
LLPHLQWWINRENVMKGLSLSVSECWRR